ncbi:ankyrin repeat-containing protein [Nephila pilipes]|uniref:Ankyrin repeat-containing protein n=1 Tax=Nephila pilipes TaxID=299642 RepID=A0A8X6TDK0_NEPPI|nr:ankyrin repeat-containing protein [Nephila pilipes]
MNKKEVLEILGSNPSEYEIRKAYGKLADENLDGINSHEDLKFYLYTALFEQDIALLTDENLDGINSHEDLKFYLYTALCGQDIAFLKKLFSKFKSSKDGKFGDYVNEMYLGSYLPLHFIRILERSEIVELLLKHGANPDIKNKQSETPLIRASNSGYYKTVEILLKYSC